MIGKRKIKRRRKEKKRRGRIYDIFCGEVLMQDKGDGKILEFLDWFRIGFQQGI